MPDGLLSMSADFEAARIRGMIPYQLEGLAGDPRIDRIAKFAAALCETPIALVSFVEEDRQWFPARVGLEPAETPRAASFCAHSMRQTHLMIVPDATLDPRFRENPLVSGPPHIRFYAGAPLVADGTPLGALCIIDTTPRPGLTALQQQGLETLASNVVEILRARRESREGNAALQEQEAKFRILADAMPQMVWSTRPDGFHDYYNARWYEFTGMPVGSTDGELWNGMFHPDDQDRAWEAWRHSLSTGEPYEIEYRLRDSHGEYRWTLGRALPIRGQDGAITRWFGTCTDIHEQKMLQIQREILAQELSHRIKNIFSVISGLITFAARDKPAISGIADDLRNRISALGRAHDFVRPHSEASRPTNRPNTLAGMLSELFGAHAERIVVSGDDIEIDDRSATPLALIFHELATNAAKYGALLTVEGSVTVNAGIVGDRVIIDWMESGGPEVVEPAETGFGSKLIELSAIRQLGGRLERKWQPDGLQVQISLPSAAMFRGSKRDRCMA